MAQIAQYTAKLQAGLGLVAETKLLLRIWDPGMTASTLYKEALASGQFPNVTARRLRNIVVECFAPRYASDAPDRLGRKESALYDNLKWVGEVKRALENGLETTIASTNVQSGGVRAKTRNNGCCCKQLSA